MKIIIAGGGSVGRYMAEQLQLSGHTITIVDNDPVAVAKHGSEHPSNPVNWILGDACELNTLRSAGAADADVVAAVTGDDEDNLVVSLLAKQEFTVPRVVARVNNPRNEWMFNDMWGIDLSVSTPHLLTALVEEAVSFGAYVRLLSLAGGTAQLAEVTLTESSPAIDQTIAKVALPREASIVGVVRDHHVVSPQPDVVLRVGDEVLVLVQGDNESAVRAALVG